MSGYSGGGSSGATPIYAPIPGQSSADQSLPVVIAVDQTPIPVSGSFSMNTPGLPSSVGQNNMSASMPVVIAADQTPIPVSGSFALDTPGLPSALGQTNMVASMPVVLASNHSPILVTGSIGLDQSQPLIFTGSVGIDQSQPLIVTGSVGIDQKETLIITGSVGIDQGQALIITGSVGIDQKDILNVTFAGDAAINDNSGSLTIDTPQLPASLGQTTAAGSVSVVLASNQSALTITGSVGIDQSAPLVMTGSVGIDQNGPLLITGSVGIDQGQVLVITGSVGIDQGQVLSVVDSRLPSALGQATMAASLPVTMASNQSAMLITGSVGIDQSQTLNVAIAASSAIFKGRACTFRTPGRAGTAGQKILSLHNATGSPVSVTINKVFVDIGSTVVKAVTVAPPILRLWKVTVLPTNGTALAKTKIGGSGASNAAVTVLGDASADGTGSGTTLTATLPPGTFVTQEFAPRLITAVGYEVADRIEWLGDTEVVLGALEGVVVFLDYTLATQNPVTDMWIAGVEWTEA